MVLDHAVEWRHELNQHYTSQGRVHHHQERDGIERTECGQ
jgi:hypothetical protein